MSDIQAIGWGVVALLVVAVQVYQGRKIKMLQHRLDGVSCFTGYDDFAGPRG